MDTALVYVVRHAAFHAGEFFRHWYVHSMRMYWGGVVNRLERLDQMLAWRATLRHIREPLYGDYSAVGYVLGFLFRTGRLAVGTAVYAVFLVLAVLCYAVWIGIPPFLIVRAVIG